MDKKNEVEDQVLDDEDVEAFRGGLSEEQIEQIADTLRAGRPLPPYLFPHLFERPKEYELSYAGKARRADVLAETLAVPLQAVKRFGGNGPADWTNLLILGDNIQVLKHLLDLKVAGVLRSANGRDGAKLIYIDPPFATGEAWETRAGRIAYEDRLKGAQFIEWLRRRLILLREVLADDGSLIVHLDHRYVHYIKVVLDELFPGNFRNQIVVPRGVKGVQSQFENIDALAQGHYALLLYSKATATRYRKLLDPGDKPSRWDTFWLGTDRPTMRYELFGITPDKGQWRWSEEKARQAISNYETYLREAPHIHIEEYAAEVEERTGERPDFLREGEKGPQWYRYAKTTRLASDVWTVKTSGSITGFPTEKHEDLLERLIDWLTVEGDLVLDAFSGSGTTIAVAERLGRRWIGIDSTKYAIYTGTARLLRQRQRRETHASTFTLNMAGLYDYELLRSLPWDEYRAFVLSLFQCRSFEEDVRGVMFDGFLDDDRVLVYNFTEYPEAKIGEDFVADLARLCGEALSDRCFIIAPALTVAPYEDYLDVQGTRFYFLRIPYSLIAELHKRRFTELRQPTSLTSTNAVMDSIGFDFIQQPRVECKYEANDDALTISILEFESEAYAASPSEENIADLAMVLVDHDYDGEIFDVDAVYYAEDLQDAGWQVDIVTEDVGERLMIVYIDVYGNELRETKSLEDFEAKRSSRPGRPSRPGHPARRVTPSRPKTTAARAKKTTSARAKTTAAAATSKPRANKKPTKKKPTKRKPTKKKPTTRKTPTARANGAAGSRRKSRRTPSQASKRSKGATQQKNRQAKKATSSRRRSRSETSKALGSARQGMKAVTKTAGGSTRKGASRKSPRASKGRKQS